MKRLFFIIIIISCLISTGLAEENLQQPPDKGINDAEKESVDDSKNYKDVCVKRDGYGLCLEFEKRCND